MRIVAISDTHAAHREIDLPRGDVLVHAGDVTWRGELDVMADFNEWIGEAKRENGFREAILVAGNHDFSLETSDKPAKKVLTNCRYLEDEGITVDGVRFYGSPWTPKFLSWAFMKRDEKLEAVWARIPADTDVLITHGPPEGVLDLVPRGEHAGSETLKARLATLAIPAHVFGHIHEGHGTLTAGTTTFLNASICDEGYQPTNAPLVFDFDPATRRVTVKS